LVGEARTPARKERTPQRRNAGQINVILDDHKAPGLQLGVDAPCRIGDKKTADTHAPHQFYGQDNRLQGNPFVIVAASHKGDDAQAMTLKDHHLARVARNGACSEPRNIRIGDTSQNGTHLQRLAPT